MINSSSFLPNMIKVLKNAPGLEDKNMIVAYENNIKPYPVNEPIIALSYKKITLGDRIVKIQPDGAQVVTKQRPVDIVVRISFFVPYASGPAACFRLFDLVSEAILFISTGSVPATNCYSCQYVRDCGALVLHADFTMREVASPWAT